MNKKELEVEKCGLESIGFTIKGGMTEIKVFADTVEETAMQHPVTFNNS